MSADRKLEVLRAVDGSVVGVAEALARLEISPSTYYRWRQRFRTGGVQGLHDRNPSGIGTGTSSCRMSGQRY